MMSIGQPIQMIILMGVSGCGKTTVGKALANALGWRFFDGDAFHPPENIAKMSAGIPLNDDDRFPWLAQLNKLIGDCVKQNSPAVLACSALKARYRDQLLTGNEGVQIVYLRGDFELVWQRMNQRRNHYMKPEMLQSQYDSLEEPTEEIVLIIDIGQSVKEIVAGINNFLKENS